MTPLEVGQSYSRREILDRGAINLGMFSDCLMYKQGEDTLFFRANKTQGTMWGTPCYTILISDMEHNMEERMPLVTVLGPSRRQAILLASPVTAKDPSRRQSPLPVLPDRP
ncbi:hypothetical protein HN592_04375 [Candidatus Woesearchaeota archaeon]|jgi:hypothetical protein|nr:hypothetical protein [Candidatus Woesearchaeota archaeon]MBT4368449.1 hypothetical protein [Candidatus Woesearchaeota archaeon]MBT4712938.1 hypothetical protein [Candidatus Woesearchaeota archaeon]MBT6639850.1 hypothetical protein [Candidatus Woesearchaeota archaeon]MBT7134022.1 hypothetical protein [Candidatus Woesearchaeota archaeon]